MCPRRGNDPASGHPRAHQPPLGRGTSPPAWDGRLDAPGQRRRHLPSSAWTRRREVKQGKSGGSVGTTDQGKGKGRSVVRPMGTVAYRGKGQGKGKGRGEGRLGQGGRGRSKGGEKLMGTTAYGGKGSKGRAANGDRPVGAASCRRDHHTMASCQNPPPRPQVPALMENVASKSPKCHLTARTTEPAGRPLVGGDMRLICPSAVECLDARAPCGRTPSPPRAPVLCRPVPPSPPPPPRPQVPALMENVASKSPKMLLNELLQQMWRTPTGKPGAHYTSQRVGRVWQASVHVTRREGDRCSFMGEPGLTKKASEESAAFKALQALTE